MPRTGYKVSAAVELSDQLASRAGRKIARKGFVMARGNKPDSIINVLKGACDDMKNDETRKAYQRGARDFALYVREEHGINYGFKLPGDHAGRVDLIKSYTEHLKERGMKDHSIHGYLAGVCHSVSRYTSDHISEGEIDNKPRRGLSTKGRDPMKNRQGRMEAVQEKNARLMEIAGAIGIRRAEYAKLDGRSYRPDESGYMCVWVKGKGGKIQAQRILPWSVPIVSNAFSGVRGKEKVFGKEDLENHIDLHSVRRQVARRAYEHYHWRLQTDPSYKSQLQRELVARYDAMHPHGRSNDETTRKRYLKEIYGYSGVYVCRGDNAEVLRKQGRDVAFDRLALMATSVFHLSHWRSDVTVKNYMV